MTTTLVITILSDDRPGIIETISGHLATYNTNWTESHFVNFAGKFTGILKLEVADNFRSKVIDQLKMLNSPELQIQVSETLDGFKYEKSIHFSVTAHDRPGIVQEISKQLALHQFSIELLDTSTESGAMSAELIFKANVAVVHNYNNLDSAIDILEECLEALQDDLIVEF